MIIASSVSHSSRRYPIEIQTIQGVSIYLKAIKNHGLGGLHRFTIILQSIVHKFYM